MVWIFQLLALMKKEFLAIWSDKKSRTIIIIPPLMQLFLFSFAVTLEVKNIDIAVLDRDNSTKSQEIIRNLRRMNRRINDLAEVAVMLNEINRTTVISIDDFVYNDSENYSGLDRLEDKNAIPPIILKTDSLDDEKMVQDLMTMLQMLKSNAFGVFNKDVEIDTLKQDSESKFLELIAYCDKKQNELILGGNLTGSSEKVGSQALGTVHENRLKEIIKSDAKKISKFVTNYLLKLCELNFSYAPVFDFIIDVVDDENVEALKTKAETQEIKSKTIQNLTNIGYKIPIEYIEKEFDIKGIKFESFANTKEPNHILEANKVKKLPVDHIDMALNQKAVIDKQKIDEKDINTILEKLINESNSYEEVYSKILDLYSDIELNSLEKSLTNYISSSYLIGTLEDE